MSNVEVVKSHPAPECGLNSLRSQIRERAYELFLRGGGGPGHELEDWLGAEKDHLYRPPAEMAKTDSEVRLCVAVPGFYPEHLRVTAEPDSIVVEGRSFPHEPEGGEEPIFSEFRNCPLLRARKPNRSEPCYSDPHRWLLWIMAREEKSEAAPTSEAQRQPSAFVLPVIGGPRSRDALRPQLARFLTLGRLYPKSWLTATHKLGTSAGDISWGRKAVDTVL